MRELRQSTAAISLKIGPFVDDTDGYTPETGLTINQADVRLSKNGGNFAQKTDTSAATHDENGYYDVSINVTDNGTLGRLRVAVYVAGALPVFEDFMVVSQQYYDAKYGTALQQVDLRQIGGNSVTAGNVAELRLKNISIISGAEAPIDIQDTAGFGVVKLASTGGGDVIDMSTSGAGRGIDISAGQRGISVVSSGAEAVVFDGATIGLDIEGNAGDGIRSRSLGGNGNGMTLLGNGSGVALNADLSDRTIGTADSLGSSAQAQVNSEVDQALLDYDSGNGVAKESSVEGIQNNTRAVVSLPNPALIPDTGDTVYRIDFLFYDTDGNMEDPDSNDVGLDLETAGGTSKAALLYKEFAATNALDNSGISGYKKLERADVGRYFCYLKIASTETVDQFVYMFALDENSVRLYYTRSQKVLEENPGSVTLADNNANKDIVAEAMKSRDVSGTGAVSGSIHKDIMDNIDANETKIDSLDTKLGSPGDLGSGSTVADNLGDMAGATFSSSTDSLEAIRNRGDAAWSTSGMGLANLRTGTAQAGGATSITLDAGADANDDYYNKARVVIVSGAGAGQSRYITDYDGTTKVATVSEAWVTNPDNSSVFEIQAADSRAHELGAQAVQDMLVPVKDSMFNRNVLSRHAATGNPSSYEVGSGGNKEQVDTTESAGNIETETIV